MAKAQSTSEPTPWRQPLDDLISLKVHRFGRSQPVAVGHKDRRGVAVAVAVALGCVHEVLDLGRREVFTCA